MFYLPESDRGWVVEPIYGESALVKQTLDRMAAHPESPGHSDIGVRNLIYTTIVNLRPRRVLEIGCHIGSGAVVIGAALRKNNYGKLFSLEPQDHYANIAQHFVDEAELSDRVQIVRRFSYEEECKNLLFEQGPFDVIFIDGSHEYDDAFHDIALSYELLRQNGMAILHDVGRASPGMDTSQKGGVRKALKDFAADKEGGQVIYFEHPLWPNPCGAAMLCKQEFEPAI